MTYLSDQARDFQEQAKKENLDAAWDMVQARRQTSSNGTIVDLHGTNVNEAVQIVRNLLEESMPTSCT